MHTRSITLQDWDQVLAIRSWYDTDGALKLDRQLDGEAIITTLRPAPYPRSIRIDQTVQPPPIPLQLLDDEHYVVAEEGGEPLGYLRALADFDRGIGWITHCVVRPNHRRNHVGFSLMESVKRWADRSDLRYLQAEVETRNMPGIRFLQACGFDLAGFNEHLLRDRIVVFYSYKLA
jgi:GNAT superfamily N-acetyltransferase